MRKFFNRIEQIPHVQRIRIHSRLPVVLPSRVTKELLTLLKSTRLQPIFVIHANHPAELVEDCEDALHLLVKSGIPTLNQAVLLKGVNEEKGHDLIRVMRERLPGYAVPTFVQEIPGESSKTVLPRL